MCVCVSRGAYGLGVVADGPLRGTRTGAACSLARRVEVVAARGLAAMDSNGLSDPYTIVKLFAAPDDKKECDKVVRRLTSVHSYETKHRPS